MFKKFKDKLAEEMKQSPARLQASMQQLAQAVSPALSNSSIQDLSTSNDNFSLTEEGDETPKNSPAKHGFQSVELTPPTNSQGISRRSSVTSVTSASDASSLFPIYESPGNMYHLQSDIEQSASEADDNMSSQLDRVSKEQLYTAYRKVQGKYHKYRGRYTDLANHYREMEKAKNKLETVLVETQDKALRRIADLKEQCQLEQQAKAHLEDALRNDIEEKDHVIDTLNTKVRLLQANGSAQLNESSNAHVSKENSVGMLVDLSTDFPSDPIKDSSQELALENNQLRSKLEKLEGLLTKYKESLKKNKEKMSEITQDKTIIERDFEVEKNSTSEKFKAMEDDLINAKEEITQLQNQIGGMKMREEESAISLAENKLSIHRELEVKEEQIKELNLELKALNVANESLLQSSERYRKEVENLKLVQSDEEKSKQVNEDLQRSMDEIEKRLTERYQVEVDKNKNFVIKIEQLEKEVDTMKNIEEELGKVKSELEKVTREKDEQIQGLNSKIQIYATAIRKAKEKIEAQNAQIKQFNERGSSVDEDTEKLKDELESKNVELLGLGSELKSCRSTINDLREKLKENGSQIDQLKREKVCLIANIMDYKKKIGSLKSTCREMKSQVTNFNLEQSEEISTVKKDIEASFNNMNLQESKESEEQINSRIQSLEAEKLRLEKELKLKNDENSELLENVNAFDMVKHKNNKLIAEIDNLNFKLFDLAKLREELDSTKMELERANGKLKNYETENQNSMETIRELSDLKEQCENYMVQLNEAVSKSENLQLENSGLRENHEELIRLRSECENYSKLFQENMSKAKILQAENEDLKINWEEAEKSIESFKSEILQYQSVIENNNKELENWVAENKTLKDNFGKAEESVNTLRSEILKQSTLIEEKNTGLVSWERKFIEQSEELSQLQVQFDNHKQLLEESLEKSRNLEKECRRLNDESSEEVQAQTKLKDEFENQKKSLENNLKELKVKVADKEEELSKLSMENRENIKNLTEQENKLKILEEDYSKLDTEKLSLKETLDAKSQMIEKLNALKNKQTKAIQDMSAKVQNLEGRNQVLKDFESSAKSNEENLRINLQKMNELAEENENLRKLNDELCQIRGKCKEFEDRVSQLSSENEDLKKELEILQQETLSLNKQREENISLVKKLEELHTEKDSAEIEMKQLKESNNKLLKNEEEHKNRINYLEQQCEKFSAQIEELGTNFREQIKDLENSVELLESREKDLKLEYEGKIREKEREMKELLEKEAWTSQVMEELKKRSETLEAELEERQNQAVPHGKDESSREEDRLRKLVQDFQSQLQDRESELITSQAKESQMEILNGELKEEAERLKNQLETAENEQGMRMNQLVKEFQAQLHDKDEELQAALDKKFDRQQNYESDLVQQYKEQLKDFQVELTTKSEQIESLRKDQSGESGKEIQKLVETIAGIKNEHANEMKEIEKKWRAIVKQKTDLLEAKHDDEVNELTRDWHKDKFTDEKLDGKTQDLENMSRVAMAAVQSNTGSFNSLQQTVMSQRRELAELRKIVKLRHDALEDSTEIEYLRNILYEYMMGKETLVLARVIAAVVKFDQDQTNKIIKKEEDKLTLLGSLRLA